MVLAIVFMYSFMLLLFPIFFGTLWMALDGDLRRERGETLRDEATEATVIDAPLRAVATAPAAPAGGSVAEAV